MVSDLLIATWHAGNLKGDGYAVGLASDTPKQACEREGWVIDSDEDDFCVGITEKGRMIGIANANGPWAVDLTK